MKRTVLVAAAAAVAFGSGFTGASLFASNTTPVVRVADGGESCTTAEGRSGYMVSSGRDGLPECIANGEA